MEAYVYRVVPFIGHIKSGEKDGAHKVAAQLQQVINEGAGQGWEFYRIDRVQIAVRPGCLASLLGAQTSYIGFDQIVFRRPK
jgi:hypothetical protein